MKARAWFGDTLAWRLFGLMAVALVTSHLVAYIAVQAYTGGPDGRGVIGGLERLPPLTSLPPMDSIRSRPEPPGGPRPPQADGAERTSGRPQPPDPTSPARPAGLPTSGLVLDYAIRFALIGVAAALGALWLSRPVHRLVDAAERLGPALERGTPPPALDETHGTREVRDAAQVFNRMARQIQRQFESRALMVSALSHDLRTPLTRMRMRLETGEAAAPLRERCVADIREMNALVDSVLDLFRGRGELSLQATDVGALAQALVDDLADLDQRVTGDCPRAVLPIEPVALRRVLVNLVDNGLRYGTRVHVSVHDEGDAVRLVVDDDGPGIPEAQLEAVLEPFVRVESSRSRATGGVGLGLFIARELTQRQGGTLSLRNRNGADGARGLRAEIRLPR